MMSMQFFINKASNKPYKIFYNAFVPRTIRKTWNYQYIEQPKQQKVVEYWQDVIDSYRQNKLPSSLIHPKKNYLVGKKIIWQYWHQGFDELPEVVQLCFDSVDNNCGDYQVIRLNKDSVKDYIELPDFVFEKLNNPSFKLAFFSDLIRTVLLKAYGGVWLDATIFLTDALPSEYASQDFFVFSRYQQSAYKVLAKNDAHFYFNWREEFQVRHLNSVIFAKLDSEVISALLDCLLFFWKHKSEVPHYFFYQILLNQLLENQVVSANFPVVDDVLPHMLQEKIQKQFNKEYFEYLTNTISIHKLSLHIPYQSVNRLRQQTYFGYLKEQYLEQKTN